MQVHASRFVPLLVLLVVLAVGLTVVARLFATAHTADEPEPNSGAVSTDLTAPSKDVGADTTTIMDAPQIDTTVAQRRTVAHPDTDGDATTAPIGECETEAIAPAPVDSRPARIGAIRGILVREGGPWMPANVPATNTVMLDLVSADEAHVDRRGVIEGRDGPGGALELTFAFESVPEGEYELTLSSIGGRRWSPTTLRVHCPTEGIVFTCFDKDAASPLTFEVFDVVDQSPIEDFDARMIQITPSRDNGVFLHTGPLVAEAFPLDARISWSIRSAGYATAFGDETAFERRGATRVLRVGLARGWSTQVLVLARDPNARQVRGAEIIVDGQSAGVTDAAGLLVVRRSERPESMQVKFHGWKAAHDPASSFGEYSPDQRGGVTVVMLDRE